MRRYCLYTPRSRDSSCLLHHIAQLCRIFVAKQAPTRGQNSKWICGQHRRPARWNRAQEPTAVMKVNSILSPVVAIGDQLETLASQWMVWMDDPKGTVGTAGMRCS